MVCLLCDFKILLTVFNQSYNCQTSHFLGRNWLPKPFLILPSLHTLDVLWFLLCVAKVHFRDLFLHPFCLQSNFFLEEYHNPTATIIYFLFVHSWGVTKKWWFTFKQIEDKFKRLIEDKFKRNWCLQQFFSTFSYSYLIFP